MLRPVLRVLVATDGSCRNSGGSTPIDYLDRWFTPRCTLVQVVRNRGAIHAAKARLQQLGAQWGLPGESRRLVVESSSVGRGLALAAQHVSCDLVIVQSSFPSTAGWGAFASVRGHLLTHVPLPLLSWNAAIPVPGCPPDIAVVADWSAGPATALRVAHALASHAQHPLQVACRLSTIDDALIADVRQEHSPASLEAASAALRATGVMDPVPMELSAIGSGRRALRHWCRRLQPDLLVMPPMNALTWRRRFDEALHEQTSMVLCVGDHSAAGSLLSGLLTAAPEAGWPPTADRPPAPGA